MNNSTSWGFPGGPKEYPSGYLYTACGFVMLIVFLCASFLSCSVLWALLKTKQLKCPIYRLVAFLVLDEVLVRIFGSPLIILSTLAQRWLFGESGCVFYAFWMTWLGVTATSLFTCIAIERSIIMFHKSIPTIITQKIVDAMGFACYIHGLVWACLPLVGVNHYVFEPSGVSCTPDWSQDNFNYTFGLFIVCVLMPVTVSLVCYSTIVVKVRRMRREATTLQNSSNAEKKVALTLVITMAAFLIAWTPYCVVGLRKTFGIEERVDFTIELNLISLVCAKTAGMWNPLIFSINNRDVRGFFATMFNNIKQRLDCGKLCQRWIQVPVNSNENFP